MTRPRHRGPPGRLWPARWRRRAALVSVTALIAATVVKAWPV